ncbi:hypothetical protein [Bradyrhizobium commune]|nr:hypothetical protein [Bradyrhizobium commune]
MTGEGLAASTGDVASDTQVSKQANTNNEHPNMIGAGWEEDGDNF